MTNHMIHERKTDHIEINLHKEVQHPFSTGLDRIRFIHNALPDIDMNEIDLSFTLFSKKLSAPILISSMTGGTKKAQKINFILAEAAQQKHIALALGSQRVAIENPGLEKTFQVRKYAPDVLLFSNLGAVQLNYGYGLEDCIRAVEMIQADALILHLNPLQEALQPEGNTNFKNLLHKIEIICSELAVPVVAKEVGWGISKNVARQLMNAGVSAIDIAGAGGTSWSQVEKHRVQSDNHSDIVSAFEGWGLSTVESLYQVQEFCEDIKIFASGGLRNGVDIAKCIAMGAVLGGMAKPFLHTASESLIKTLDFIEKTKKELQISMFVSGVKNIQELRKAKLLIEDERTFHEYD